MENKRIPKVLYRENYNKNTMINKTEMKRLIDENFENISIFMKQRTKYSDGIESIVIEIKF